MKRFSWYACVIAVIAGLIAEFLHVVLAGRILRMIPGDPSRPPGSTIVVIAPFNPDGLGKTIQYDLPYATDVRLAVFDGLGCRAALLVADRREPGRDCCHVGRRARV